MKRAFTQLELARGKMQSHQQTPHPVLPQPLLKEEYLPESWLPVLSHSDGLTTQRDCGQLLLCFRKQLWGKQFHFNE